jgi:hypothetical protein
MHAAVSLAAEGDDVGLAALRTIALAHHDPVFRDQVATLCGGLQAVVEGDFAAGAERLTGLLPRAAVFGGSMAQREVIEDTLVYALARSGQGERAAEVLDRRLSRRASALDARRRAALDVKSGGTTT